MKPLPRTEEEEHNFQCNEAIVVLNSITKMLDHSEQQVLSVLGDAEFIDDVTDDFLAINNILERLTATLQETKITLDSDIE